MFTKFRNVFFVVIAVFFCISQANAEVDNTKRNKKVLFQVQRVTSKKKLKEKKPILKDNKKASTTKKLKTALKNSNYKILPVERPIEICRPPLDCDIIFSNIQINNKISRSEYGIKLFQYMQNILDNVKGIYLDTISDLDCKLTIPLEYFFPCSDEYVNLNDSFEDIEKLLLLQNYIIKNDLISAESVALDMQNRWFKNIALEDIFEEYLIKNYIIDAQRIFSQMEFDLKDEEDMDEFSAIVDELIVALMKSSNFEKAESLALSIEDEFYRDYDLTLIVKYYSRIGDIQNAKRIIDMISQDYSKTEAKLFIADYFARENKIVEFQKFVLSSDDEELKNGANFILNIYQNNFELAEKNMPYNYELALFNIAEIFVSSNRITQAEYIINYFGDEFDIEDAQLFFINAYLKNSMVDEAKRIRDQIDDPFDKITASKLIVAYTKG